MPGEPSGMPGKEMPLIRGRSVRKNRLSQDTTGDWMFHCHVLEHQAGGMMGVVRVT
jgi:FtsP/CotA-like multicopper oxidase with cupredoxin domain